MTPILQKNILNTELQVIFQKLSQRNPVKFLARQPPLSGRKIRYG